MDIVMPEPLSLAKAKKYGIEARRFPLEKYVNWRTGGKHLQMDHVMNACHIIVKKLSSFIMTKHFISVFAHHARFEGRP